jgi:hypothetical protein
VLVSGQVVQDDMQVLTGTLAVEIFEENQKLLMGEFDTVAKYIVN